MLPFVVGRLIHVNSCTTLQPEQKLYHQIDWSKWKFHLDEEEEEEEEVRHKYIYIDP